MTTAILPSSRDLVRLTREKWAMDKRHFGIKLGVTGEYAGQVEHGKRNFSSDLIARGCTHPDADVRTFWQEYRTLRDHELDTAIIESCFDSESPINQS